MLKKYTNVAERTQGLIGLFCDILEFTNWTMRSICNELYATEEMVKKWKSSKNNNQDDISIINEKVISFINEFVMSFDPILIKKIDDFFIVYPMENFYKCKKRMLLHFRGKKTMKQKGYFNRFNKNEVL